MYPSFGVGPLDKYDPACLNKYDSSSGRIPSREYAPDEIARESGIDDCRVPEFVGSRHVARDTKLLEDDGLVLRLLGRRVVLDPTHSPFGGVSRLPPA